MTPTPTWTIAVARCSLTRSRPGGAPAHPRLQYLASKLRRGGSCHSVRVAEKTEESGIGDADVDL